MMINLNKSQKIMIAVVLSVAVFGGLGLWWYWSSGSKPETVQRPTPTPTPVEERPIVTPTDDPNWNLYINEGYGFSVEYPSESIISEGQLSEFGGDSISFSVASVMLFNVSVKETNKDLITLVEEGVTNISQTARPLLPNKPNATIAGVPAVVVYVADSRYSLATTYAFFRRGSFFYTIQHFVASGRQIDWRLFEHVLRVFEFDNTEDLEDTIPEFPLKSIPFTYEEH